MLKVKHSQEIPITALWMLMANQVEVHYWAPADQTKDDPKETKIWIRARLLPNKTYAITASPAVIASGKFNKRNTGPGFSLKEANGFVFDYQETAKVDLQYNFYNQDRPMDA